MSFILTHTNFVFGDHSYLQTVGTAMSTKIAPCFANLFMTSIERTFIDNSPLTPFFYVRFIDVIFMTAEEWGVKDWLKECDSHNRSR